MRDRPWDFRIDVMGATSVMIVCTGDLGEDAADQLAAAFDEARDRGATMIHVSLAGCGALAPAVAEALRRACARASAAGISLVVEGGDMLSADGAAGASGAPQT